MDVLSFFRAVVRQDRFEIRKYFCEDAVIRWHNTNEEFSVEEYIIANCDYPGEWDGEIERIEYAHGVIIYAAAVYSNDVRVHVTGFMRIFDDKICELDEYWGDDGIPPQWRLEMKIGRTITK